MMCQLKDQTKTNVLFFLILLFQFSLISTQEMTTTIFTEEQVLLSFRDTVFSVNTNEKDKEIKRYNENKLFETFGTHSSEIKGNKILVKLNDTSFILFGTNEKNSLFYQVHTYPYSEQKAFLLSKIDFNNTIHHDIHCNSLNQCVIALAKSNRFYVFKFNVSDNTSVVEMPSYITSGGDFIQCECFQPEKIFCLYRSQNIIYYYYINPTSPKQLCSNCKNGIISKLTNNSVNEFLICYQQLLTVSCQYFEVGDNDQIIEKDKFNGIYNFQRGCSSRNTTTLIMAVYNYSIFLKSSCFLGEERVLFSEKKIMSLDFKFSFFLNSMGNYYQRAINIFNDKNRYYDYYYSKPTNGNATYQVKVYDLLPSHRDDLLYITKNDLKSFDFVTGHVGYTLNLLEDPGLEVYNNGIRLTSNSIDLIESDNIQIGKTSADRITLYYGYSYEIDENNYAVSLLNKIELKFCHYSCKECNFTEPSTSSVHLCTSCDSGYYPFYEITNSDRLNYNCYARNESEVSNAYLLNDVFYYCDSSCSSCEGESDCITCKDGYYFTVDYNDSIVYTNHCFKDLSYKYYFVNNVNILNRKTNQIITSVYRPCYTSCASCTETGTINDNKCDSCDVKSNFINYIFFGDQCLINTTACVNNHTFWKIENNNIVCIDKCNYSIISEGENIGECVEDCTRYPTPFSADGEIFGNYLSLKCQNETYCIPYLSCTLIGFTPSPDGLSCIGTCNDYDLSRFPTIVDYINSIPAPNRTINTSMTINDKIAEINKSKKRIETFQEEKSYDDVIKSFGADIISNYISLYKARFPNINELGYLITSTTYNNFTITIYPLDIEDIAYENIFLIKNLGFVNFKKLYYPDFLRYEIKTGSIILACIMEYFTPVYSIKDLNYFLYQFDPTSNSSSSRRLQNNQELPTISGLSSGNKRYEIEYPLHNYISKSGNINKRNSEYLVNNIKKMNEEYPEVDLSNLEDSFYTDVCFLFTTDVGTDMSLDDRRQEYYVNYTLCENNCYLTNVIKRDTNPRSVCSCEKKSYITFNTREEKEYEIESKSSHPIKSFVCFTETFNIYIGKNPIFWIFMIILVYQIYFLTIYLKYQTKVVQNIFGIGENNSQGTSGASISSSMLSKINSNQNENQSSKNKEYSSENSISEKISSNKKSSYNNPPKKEKIKENGAVSNLNTNEKDLISKDDSTFVKENNFNNVNINNLKRDESEVSYSEIKNGFEMIEVNNLIDKNTIMENNFLSNPLAIEKMRKMKKIKRAMNPLKEDEAQQYHKTFEDVLYSNNNKQKFKNKKNKSIANNLGGEDIINKNLIDNFSDDENKPRFPRNKFENKLSSDNNGTIGSEHIIYPGNCEKIIIKENDINEIKVKIENKNKKEKNMGNKKNSLAKLLSKKDSRHDDNKKIKADDELEFNNKLKKEIKKEIKNTNKIQKIRPNSGIEKSQKFHHKKKSPDKSPKNNIRKEKIIDKKDKIISKKILDESDNSNGNLRNRSSENENNNVIKLKKTTNLKLKSKVEVNKENLKINSSNNNQNKNKDVIYINKKEEEEEEDNISSENKEGSKGNMIKFQEETEMEGDKANKEAIEKLKQKRTQNLDLLNDRAPVSSVVEFLESDSKEILIEENFLLFCYKYFQKRELWFIVIRDKSNTIPYFIRYSSLGFYITTLFLINCYFFLESDVHERYIHALDDESINISYYFAEEFGTTICVSLILNIAKMIMIKILLYRVFKIGKNVKKLMRKSAEKGLTKEEVEELIIKREQYVEWYKKGLIIYFSILMGLTIFFGYICTCYGGVYKNSINYFLFGIFFSLIFCFIFCAAICFLIVGLYKLGKMYDSKCAISAYIVLSTLY